MRTEFLKRTVWPRLPEPVQRTLFRRRLRAAMTDPGLSRRMFDYDRNRLPNAHLAALDAGTSDLEQAVAASGMSIGYPAWNLLYYALLCSLPATDAVVVETGTNNGVSTIVMAQALKDAGLAAVVRTIDLDGAVVESAKRNVAQAGLSDFVSFRVGDSVEFLRGLDTDHVDFAFLDASHERDMVLREFEAVVPLVTACGGKIYFDNTTSGGVARALAEVRRRFGGNLVEFRGCSWLPPGNAVWQP